MTKFTAVPFTTESKSGVLTSRGVAKISRAGVVLEFEKMEFGIISSGVKEIRLSVTDLLDVEFRKGLFRFGAKIKVRTKSIESLFELPNEGGKVILRIRREDFKRAGDAVAIIQDSIRGHDQKLPFKHSPISVLFDPSEDETLKLTTGGHSD